MRLNDKLIHRNCPSCGGEIMLGASALNKKINCPKCRQIVVIGDDGHPAPAKPSAKKTAPKEKRGAGHHTPVEKHPVALPETRITIGSFTDTVEAPRMEEYGVHASGKSDVVYCICNGVLKKCTDSKACCCVQAARGAYARVRE